MKKLFCAFLMILISGIANANIHIDDKAAKEAILKYIDNDHQVDALQEYNSQLEASDDFTMSVRSLVEVCIAAGFHPATIEGYNKCYEFIHAIVFFGDHECDEDAVKQYLSETYRTTKIFRIDDYYSVHEFPAPVTDLCGNVLFSGIMPTSIKHENGQYQVTSNASTLAIVNSVSECNIPSNILMLTAMKIRDKIPNSETVIIMNDSQQVRINVEYEKYQTSFDGGKTFHYNVKDAILSILTDEDKSNLPDEWKKCLGI